MTGPERRDEAGRRESEHRQTTEWVYRVLVPKLEAEQPEPDVESVAFIHPPRPQPRRVRIGDDVYNVPPETKGSP